jgi:hypothetical protein
MYRNYGLLAALFLIAAGCNPPGQTSNGGGAQTSNGAPSNSVSSAEDTPDKAVFDFLEAVRTGNDKQAELMLTPMAREKTSEMQMVVAPPGSPTARFKVKGVEYVTPEKDGAHVLSTWTDVADDQGHTRSDDIIWVLRHETIGWRIAGMVTKVYPDQPPLILNFEDPEDMMRKQQLLHGETTNDSQEQQSQPSGQPQANRVEQTPQMTR